MLSPNGQTNENIIFKKGEGVVIITSAQQCTPKIFHALTNKIYLKSMKKI